MAFAAGKHVAITQSCRLRLIEARDQQLLQRRLEPKIIIKTRFDIWGELNQKIGITAIWTEVIGTGAEPNTSNGLTR
jgi:hypothetical protein